jgi:hypothetical protein
LNPPARHDNPWDGTVRSAARPRRLDIDVAV